MEIANIYASKNRTQNTWKKKCDRIEKWRRQLKNNCYLFPYWFLGTRSTSWHKISRYSIANQQALTYLERLPFKNKKIYVLMTSMAHRLRSTWNVLEESPYCYAIKNFNASYTVWNKAVLSHVCSNFSEIKLHLLPARFGVWIQIAKQDTNCIWYCN